MTLDETTRRVPAPTARLTVTDAGVVLRHGEPQFGDQLGARDVWVFPMDAGYGMHYDAAGERGWLAALATSDDGVAWRKHGPILDFGAEGEQDSGSASYGTVFRDGDRWHMFHLGTPNVADDGYLTPAFPYLTLKAEADSPLGPWRKRRDVVPFRAVPGTWYDETASPGAVILVDGGYLMLFSAATSGTDGRTWRTLGVARTGDLDSSWTVDPEPLLPFTEQIENSSLYFEESTGTWFLFTNHIAEVETPEGVTEYTDAVWVYWADDPLSFSPERKAIAVDSSIATWSPRIIGLPSVVRIGGQLAIYFDGSTRDTTDHGRRDVGLAWVALPLERPHAVRSRGS